MYEEAKSLVQDAFGGIPKSWVAIGAIILVVMRWVSRVASKAGVAVGGFWAQYDKLLSGYRTRVDELEAQLVARDKLIAKLQSEIEFLSIQLESKK